MTRIERRRALGAGVLAGFAFALGGCCARTCAPVCGAPACVPAAAFGAGAASAPRAASSEAEAPAVMVEGTCLSVPAAKAGEVLGATYGAGALSMGMLSAADAAALLGRAKAAGARVLQAPSVVTRSGEQASIFVGEGRDPTPQLWAGANGYEAALADPYWSGLDLRMTPTLRTGSDLSFDLSVIARISPSEGPPTDPTAWLGPQLHGRMGVARMASGDAAVIVLATAQGAALGDRFVVVATPRVLSRSAAPVATPSAVRASGAP